MAKLLRQPWAMATLHVGWGQLVCMAEKKVAMRAEVKFEVPLQDAAMLDAQVYPLVAMTQYGRGQV